MYYIVKISGIYHIVWLSYIAKYAFSPHICIYVTVFQELWQIKVLVIMAIKSELASHVYSFLKNCIMKFVHLSEPQFVSECIIIDNIKTWREKDSLFFIKTGFINKSCCISVTEDITYHNNGYWMISKKRWKC